MKNKTSMLLIIPMLVITLMAFTSCESYNSNASKNSTKNTSSSITSKSPSTSIINSSNSDSTTELEAFEVVSFYKMNKGVDYIAYQKENPQYTAEQVVAFVNLGLNSEFYTEIEQVSDPDSLLVLCSKNFALPNDYKPSDLVKIPSEISTSDRDLYLREEAANAFKKLAYEARDKGHNIIGQSAYRSFSYQKTLYDNYVKKDGVKEADRYSARPGHSEHQTGLVIDVRTPDTTITTFHKTSEYQWLKENSHKFGYIIHYTKESEWITGYKEEQWHIRYLGLEHAKKVRDLGITIDEYLISFV